MSKKISSRERQSVEEFHRSMKQIEETLKADPTGQFIKPENLPIDETGLCNLINSMDCVSPRSFTPSLEEWNPFSQRPICSVYSDYPADDFCRSLHLTTDAISRFLEFSHECMHVLLWEPFFTGHLRPRPEKFANTSLAFEGCCFWHTDLVVNNKLNVVAPDGEFAFRRHSLSQSTVHPNHVLKQLHWEDPIAILKIYVAAFTGHETPFSSNSSEPLSYALATRFYSFFKDTLRPSRKLFSALHSLGLFTEYLSRFCKVENMPSLLPSELLKMDVEGDPAGYCVRVCTEGLKFLHHLKPNEVSAVRLRRAIQTRAYFAMTVRFLLKKNHYRESGPFPAEQVLRSLEDYLNRLEATLEVLCSSPEPTQCRRLLKPIDRFYSQNVRKPLQQAHVRSTRKEMIYPPLRHHDRISLLEDRSGMSLKNLRGFAHEVFKTFALPALAKMPATPDGESLIRELRLMTRDLRKLDVKSSASQSQQLKQKLSQRIDKILVHDLTFKKWSMSLDSVDPERNGFRELLIHYT